MLAFATRRLFSGLVVVLLLTLLAYVVFQLIPVDPGCLRVACGPGSHSTDADIRAADHQLGVDRPLAFQYARFLWRFVRHGSLGTTWIGETSVNAAIAHAVPVTVSIVAGGIVLLLALAVPLGCVAALRPRSPADRGLLAFGVLGIAIHPFVLAIVLRDLLGNGVGIPSAGYCPLGGGSPGCGGPQDWAGHLVLPWICFALFFLPLYLRMIRVRLLEALAEPYVVTARAKGASEARVLGRHVLRNAVGPLLPMVAADAGTALTAAIYLEVVFQLPGLGRLAVAALSGEAGGYDRPLVVGIVATVATAVVLFTLASDVGSAWLDPRVRSRTPTGLVRLPRRLADSRLGRMPRPIRVAAALAAVAVAAAIVYTRPPPRVSTALVPPVRVVHVHWRERHPVYGGTIHSQLLVRVSEVRLGRRGWQVKGGVTNLANGPLAIQPGAASVTTAGFSLVYAYRSQGFNELRVLNATQFTPALPPTLQPRESWRGSFSGVEAVPGGNQFYVGFGAFAFVGATYAQTSVVTTASAVTPRR